MRDLGFAVHTDDQVEDAAEDAPADAEAANENDITDAAMEALAKAPGLGERPALGVRLELYDSFFLRSFPPLTPLGLMKVTSSAGGCYGGTCSFRD